MCRVSCPCIRWTPGGSAFTWTSPYWRFVGKSDRNHVMKVVYNGRIISFWFILVSIFSHITRWIYTPAWNHRSLRGKLVIATCLTDNGAVTCCEPAIHLSIDIVDLSRIARPPNYCQSCSVWNYFFSVWILIFLWKKVLICEQVNHAVIVGEKL